MLFMLRLGVCSAPRKHCGQTEECDRHRRTGRGRGRSVSTVDIIVSSVTAGRHISQNNSFSLALHSEVLNHFSAVRSLHFCFNTVLPTNVIKRTVIQRAKYQVRLLCEVVFQPQLQELRIKFVCFFRSLWELILYMVLH